MCGIYGHIGKRKMRNSAALCIDGLKRLEYRGYDSAGIASVQDGKILSLKSVGKVAALEEIVQDQALSLEMAIAHTRWATHGGLTQENAHPHTDENDTIAVVHNGIIENFHTLKDFLQEHGVSFSSDTDSEVISQLIAYHYNGDLVSSVRKALQMTKGAFALAIIHQDHPNTIVTAARGCPLVVAVSRRTGDVYISSDSHAFAKDELDVFYLHDDEVCKVSTQELVVYNKKGKVIAKETELLKLDTCEISKGKYDHFLLKEIHEQPHAIRNTFLGRIDRKLATVRLNEMVLGDRELKQIKRVLILGCGSAYHAGCIGASVIEAIARVPTRVEIASEFRYSNPIIEDDTLVIAISQSGETADTLGALLEMKKQGVSVVSICNVERSSIVRESLCSLPLNAGPEISVCSTKAFTCQLTMMMMIALKLARLKGMPKKKALSYLDELERLPQVVQEVLKSEKIIAKYAKRYKNFAGFFFIGRQHMLATCLEGALKLKEITYFESTAYPAGEMKHGPIALISPKHPTIALCGNTATNEKLLSNLMEIRSRGGPILAFAPAGDRDIYEATEDVIQMPNITSDLFAPIPYAVASQLFAYHLAVLHKRDIDQPRNLAKSVTVE